jgi:hypothetical protein
MAAALLPSLAVCLLASAPSAGASAVPVSQALVVLTHDHFARTSPSVGAHRIEAVSARRPLTGSRTVLPVLRHAIRGGRSWADVRLPGRPNGHHGWILTSRTRASSTGWRLLVDLSARRVTVYEFGHVVRRFRAIVGKPSTPTPRGRFFIEETLALDAGASGAPYALATSARSHVFQEFDGGPGQIGLHGRAHLSGALGTASSHGCVRLDRTPITWLAQHIGAGTPLTIVR